MTPPWELQDPIPETPYDRAKKRRKNVATAAIALLVMIGLVGTTVISLF